VAFQSESQQVLPANLHGGWQVYVVDRSSGLLRRISVRPDHALGSNCAVEPAMSGDGRVIAYRTTSHDLIADDLNAAPDVLVSEWACANVGTFAPPDALPASCDPVPACPAEPADGCTAARRSSLEIQTHPPGSEGRSRAQVRWIWRGGALAPSAFGNPAAATAYAFCVYGGPRAALQVEEKVAPGVGWTSVPGGFSFGGGSAVHRVTLHGGGHHSGIHMRGAGRSLIPLPLVRAFALVRLQLGFFGGGLRRGGYPEERGDLRATPPDHRDDSSRRFREEGRRSLNDVQAFRVALRRPGKFTICRARERRSIIADRPSSRWRSFVAAAAGSGACAWRLHQERSASSGLDGLRSRSGSGSSRERRSTATATASRASARRPRRTVSG
jgi:hypothetical protein